MLRKDLCGLAPRKHLRAKVTPSFLKYSKNGGKPWVGIAKRNISLFLNISIILVLCLFNFLLYKINHLYTVKFIYRINKKQDGMTEIQRSFMSTEMLT